MFHPDFTKMMVRDHLEQLRRDARVVRGRASTPAVDTNDVELRLCRVSDDRDLDRLAELDGRPVPYGRMVVAAVGGRVVAALPLAGGEALRDPEPRRRLIPRYVNLMRGSIHA